jgi:hypothetical protein
MTFDVTIISDALCPRCPRTTVLYAGFTVDGCEAEGDAGCEEGSLAGGSSASCASPLRDESHELDKKNELVNSKITQTRGNFDVREHNTAAVVSSRRENLKRYAAPERMPWQ